MKELKIKLKVSSKGKMIKYLQSEPTKTEKAIT